MQKFYFLTRSFIYCYSCDEPTTLHLRCVDCTELFCAQCMGENGYCRQTAKQLCSIENYLKYNRFLWVKSLTPAQILYLSWRQIRLQTCSTGFKLTAPERKPKRELNAIRGTRKGAGKKRPSSLSSPLASQ